MEYTRLGRAGVKVSRICMGTMTFGREADQEMSFRILDRFFELGGNFVDTADQYASGNSEKIVGAWIRERGIRDDIVLATKVYAQTGPGPNEGGLSRLHLQHGIEASLTRLDVEVIDLYQIHRWDPGVPLEETLGALDDLVHQGKVRYVGCSNLKGWHLAKFLHIARDHDWSPFVSIQPLYNAINRAIELEVLPLCEREGLGVISYNPLAGGLLTGKYRKGQSLPDHARMSELQNYYERYYTEQAIDLVEAFCAAAESRGLTPPQLALAWVLAEPRVTCPIVGARNLEQLNDTLGGLEVDLTPEDREAIPAMPSGGWVGIDPVYDRTD